MFANAILRAAVLSGIATASIAALSESDRLGFAPVTEGIAAAAVPIVATAPPPPMPATEPASLRTERHSDGLFYVQAKVNGRPIRFLVDTGASYMVLTDADARAAGIVVDRDKFVGRVSTVGGDAAMAWTKLERIELAGHDVRGLRAVVVRDGLGVSLLGQNMLEKLDSVTLTEGRLHLR